MDRAVVTGLRRAARRSVADLLEASAKTKPHRPRATGTFERSFVVVKLPNGAAVANSARHARFVEVGRRKGRQPPIKPLVEWIIRKRLARPGRARHLAFMVARKIARTGTPGKFVFRRALPKIAKRVPVEVDRAMTKEFARQAAARGRGR